MGIVKKMKKLSTILLASADKNKINQKYDQQKIYIFLDDCYIVFVVVVFLCCS